MEWLSENQLFVLAHVYSLHYTKDHGYLYAYVFRKFPLMMSKCTIDRYVIKEVIRYGDFNLFQYLHRQEKLDEDVLYHASNAAALYKQLEILQYICKYIKPSEHIMHYAVKGGDLKLFKWLESIGVPFCEYYYAINDAACYGHLHVLQYIIKTHPEINIDEDVSSSAARYGRFPVVQWLIENNYDCHPFMLDEAARSGNLEMVQWIHAHGGQWTHKAADIAASNGDFDMLKWIHANGGQWSHNAADRAASNGDFDMLKWIRAHGGDWSEDASYSAAINNDFEMLKWIVEQGGECNSYTTSAATETGNLDMLQWLVERGCDWDSTCAFTAVACGYFDILKWIRAHGGDWDPLEVTVTAISQSHMEILKWILDNGGCVPDLDTLRFMQLGEKNDSTVLKYVLKTYYNLTLEDLHRDEDFDEEELFLKLHTQKNPPATFHFQLTYQPTNQ